MKKPRMVSTVRGFLQLESGYIDLVFLPNGFHDRINVIEEEPWRHFDAGDFPTLNPRVNRVRTN